VFVFLWWFSWGNPDGAEMGTLEPSTCPETTPRPEAWLMVSSWQPGFLFFCNQIAGGFFVRWMAGIRRAPEKSAKLDGIACEDPDTTQ